MFSKQHSLKLFTLIYINKIKSRVFSFILSFVQSICICFLWKELALERMIEIPKLTEFDPDKGREAWLNPAKKWDPRDAQGTAALGTARVCLGRWASQGWDGRTPEDGNCSKMTSSPLKLAYSDAGYGNLASTTSTKGILDWFADRCPRGIRRAMWTDIRI